jgi:hypothetical protein
MTREWVVVSCCLALVGCSSNPTSERLFLRQGAVVSPPTTFTVTLQTPKSVAPATVTLGATGSITIGGGATISAPGTSLSTITNVGSGGVVLQPAATLGNLWSTSNVTVGSRVHALGTIHATSVNPPPDATVHIDQGIDLATPLLPAVVTSWTVTYPSATVSNISVSPNQTASKAPGRYGTVLVSAGATLSLSAGTYYFDTLDIEPGAKFSLTQTTGPVVVYVRTSVIYHGAIVTSPTGSTPDFLLVYLGTIGITLDSSFTGGLIAPSAATTLRAVTGGHAGVFFGASFVVDANATVNYRAPNALLAAQGTGTLTRGACAASIIPNYALATGPRELQYQQDIIRYCTGTDIPACEVTLRARMNVDFYTAAAMLFTNRITPGIYLQVVRDRDAALIRFKNNPTLACSVVAHDGDGDYVPDSADACPTTPPFTPVLANGCTNTQVPAGPSATDVQSVVKNLGVNLDPRCFNAPVPSIPTPLGAWRLPSDPTVGKAIWLSRDPTTSQCPLYYQLEVNLTDGQPVRTVTFAATEDTTLPWITRPSGAVQFNVHTTDSGNRATWASYSVYTRSYRARAFNAGGRRSDWSDYVAAGGEDCVVGEACVDR